MGFKGQLVCMFFPGGLLIVIGASLRDVLPDLGLPLAMLGFLLLIAWPIFTITVHVRHERRLKRQQKRDSESVALTQARIPSEDLSVRDPLHTFVTTVETLILMFGLPVAFLGGLGVFCLVTAGDDPNQKVLKAAIGVGSLGLLGGYLLILLRGRSPQTLRIIGVAVAVFGLAGLVAVASVLVSEGVTSVGDIVMAIAGVVMTAAGTWLAITGRNTVKRRD
ncbi:hypothetical protein [Brevibacterium picturae]|uniref:Transmembrane protein n=1 Tax=Brevibacterium picturae TaxID=260553 RepID=A0ABN2CLK5_9MICO